MKLKFTYFSAWVFFLCLILGEYSLNAQQTFSKLTNHSDVTADGTYMIVDVNGSYALTSAKTTPFKVTLLPNCNGNSLL